MDGQHMLIFRDAVTCEDIGVFITCEKYVFKPGQSISIPTIMNGREVRTIYIIDKVLDAVVLCKDSKSYS